MRLAVTGVGVERERRRGRESGEEVGRGRHICGSLHPREEAEYAPGECGSVNDPGLHFHAGARHSGGRQEFTPPGRSASPSTLFRMAGAW